MYSPILLICLIYAIVTIACLLLRNNTETQHWYNAEEGRKEWMFCMCFIPVVNFVILTALTLDSSIAYKKHRVMRQSIAHFMKETSNYV